MRSFSLISLGLLDLRKLTPFQFESCVIQVGSNIESAILLAVYEWAVKLIVIGATSKKDKGDKEKQLKGLETVPRNSTK